MMAKPYLKLLGGWAQEISPREQGGSQRILEPHIRRNIAHSILILHKNIFQYAWSPRLLLLALLGKFSQENSSGNGCRWWIGIGSNRSK